MGLMSGAWEIHCRAKMSYHTFHLIVVDITAFPVQIKLWSDIFMMSFDRNGVAAFIKNGPFSLNFSSQILHKTAAMGNFKKNE